jgi:hypothetical protein
MKTTIGPKDFAPYLAEIRDCCCILCLESAYAQSDVLDIGGRRHLAAAEAILAALRDGTHTRRERSAYHAEQRKAKEARLDAARDRGATPSELAAIDRGYTKVSMADFYGTGLGIGMTPKTEATTCTRPMA